GPGRRKSGRCGACRRGRVPRARWWLGSTGPTRCDRADVGLVKLDQACACLAVAAPAHRVPAPPVRGGAFNERSVTYLTRLFGAKESAGVPARTDARLRGQDLNLRGRPCRPNWATPRE